MLQYTAGSNKGATKAGDVFNSVFGLGKVDPEYTSARVTESFVTGQTTLAWSPILPGSFKKADDTVLGDVKIIKAADGSTIYGTFASEAARQAGTLTGMTFKAADGSTISSYTIVANDKLAYVYDNQVIPQNDLPILNAKLEAIPLVAHARRIAIYYSQIAAFQAKQDYGFDLGDQLAEKAVGQLRYEIDTEICDGLIAAAGAAQITWNRAMPTGVSKAEHYEGFSEAVEIAKQIIYDRTKRFVPNYMLIASDILPILAFIKGFQAAPTGSINGPYFAGTLNGVKVFVTPNIKAGKFVLGVNGDDMMTSAAVYGVYMPVVPTQLLQYADGGTSQGFSTLYDFKILNANLLVAGEVTGSANDFQVLHVNTQG